MNTCKTCKYWTRNEHSEVWTPNVLFGACSNQKLAYGDVGKEFVTVKICDDDNFVIDSTTIPMWNATDMLVYSDDEDYRAHLTTGQDFGCIHWAALSNA